MNKDKIITNTEKYLNQCFKDLSISEIEKIEINKDSGITYKGDEKILKESFNTDDLLEIRSEEIILKNITEKEFEDIIEEINQKIEDFNYFAGKRKGVNFF